MASLVQELLIKVGIKSDTAQSKDAAASVERIGNAVKATAPEMQKAGTASKDMARGIGEGAAAGNAAVSAMANLSTASKGGAESIMAIARAGFAAGTSLKAVVASMGPFGIAAAAIGIALGVVSLAFKQSEDAAEEARKKLEEVNKTKLEALATELGRITSGAEAMKTALDSANASAERISDAKLADQLAANKVSNTSPEEKAKNEVVIRRRREDEKRAAAQKILDDKAEVDAAAYEETRRVANRELETVADLTAKKARLDKALSEKQSADVAIQTGGEGGLGAGLADYERAGAAQTEFDAARKAAGDDIVANLDAAVARATDAVKKIGAAAGGAINSQNKAEIERFTQRAEDPYIKSTQKSEDKAVAAKAPLTDAQMAAQNLSDLKAKEMFPSDYRGRIASGIPVDREQLKRIYPGEAFPESAPRLQGAPSGGTIQTSDGAKIKVDAKPLEKGLKDNNDKTRQAIDSELAKVAAGVAAQAVALTATAAATTTLGANQAAMQAAIETMKSQISNMRTN